MMKRVAKMIQQKTARRWLLAVVVSVLTGVAASPALAASSRGVTVAEPPGGVLEALLFYLVGGTACLSALGVCVSKNIVRMAVWLFVALGSVALIYFMLAANFLAVIQLIVYAGGTLVLLVFGVMLTSKSPWARFETPKSELALSAVVCVALVVSLCTVLSRAVWHGTEEVVPGAAVEEIGRVLLTTYLVPFEAAGILLMVVMVGAAHLARQEGS